MRNKIACLLILILSLVYQQDLVGQELSELKKELDDLFQDEIIQNGPGGIIYVVKNDEVVYSRYGGMADLKSNVPIQPETIFNTGSISKTIVAYGILILEEDGLLSIEDPITKYFTDFENPQALDGVQIKHLLAHCSGLPDLRDVRSNRSFFLAAKDEGNFHPLKRTDKLNFPVGSQFQYSNPAYNGLALIIEQVSGMRWQQFIEERIFDPAGMSSSKITDGPYPTRGVAHAYEINGSEFVENDYGEFPTFAASGNGGVWCSIGDLVKYEQAIQSHKFLSEDQIQKSRTIFHPDTWSSSRPPILGFSWWVDQSGYDIPIYYHTGSQGGFRAFHYSIPERDLLFVALFNKPFVNRGQTIQQGLEILQKHKWLE